MFKYESLFAQAENLRKNYEQANPFPHVVIDRFLHPDAVQQVVEEFPDPRSAYWRTKSNETSYKQYSTSLEKDRFLGGVTRDLFKELNCPSFLIFLSKLTGIDGLIPDPYLEGGGLHQIPRGGFLKIHADFNFHPVLKLHRRINLLLYLNVNWCDEYGGALQLWNSDVTRCGATIMPYGGRCVIFNTTDWSFHGHPDPLNSPADVFRRSIAMYYYTAERPESELSAPHNTLYKARPGEA